MSSVALHCRSERVQLGSATTPAILPTLFGEGYGQYKTRRGTFVLSFLAHILAVALLVLSGRFVAQHRQELRQEVIGIVTDVSPYILPPSASKAGGGGAEETATSWLLQRERYLASPENNWRLRWW